MAITDKTFLENVQTKGIKKILSYFDDDLDEAIAKAIKWVRRLDTNNQITEEINAVETALSDKNNNWYQLIERIYNDVDPDVTKTLVENFIINSIVIWGQRRVKAKEKYNCNIPWAILMDPTSACNLECTGCWAADYGNQMNMSLETMDDIINQGKELGIHFYLFSGGEPLVRKKDIIKLCEKHNDCVFLAFTNGTLIDEEFADEMLRVKNFIPAISIEGFEEATDSRRGDGTYQSVLKAMEILREKSLLFGASLCYTKENTEVIGSEEYIDFLIDKGVFFAWLFTYMPVGANASPELLVTADQRKFMYEQGRKARSTKAIFAMDFWNDGEYVDGCIAGGRNYLHINANGDVEPCAFVHYSDSNIHNKTLVEALQSPLFKQYEENQPFNENHLRPCPVLDNPSKIVEMVDKSNAKSTDMSAPESASDLAKKTEETAENWAPVAGELWDETIERKEKIAKEKVAKK